LGGFTIIARTARLKNRLSQGECALVKILSDNSDRTGLEAIWSSRESTLFTGFGSIDLIGGVVWIKPDGAPQLVPLRED